MSILGFLCNISVQVCKATSYKWSKKADSSPHIPEDQQRSGSRHVRISGPNKPQHTVGVHLPARVSFELTPFLAGCPSIMASMSPIALVNDLGILPQEECSILVISEKSPKWFSSVKVRLVPIPELIRSFRRPDQCHAPTHLLEVGSVSPNNIDHTDRVMVPQDHQGSVIIRGLNTEGSTKADSQPLLHVESSPRYHQIHELDTISSLPGIFLSLHQLWHATLLNPICLCRSLLSYKWCLCCHSVGIHLPHSYEPHSVHSYTVALRVFKMPCPDNAYLCLHR